ncbi:MAG TPA: PIG-L family deacetylase [Verrucomicrobiae bacterium]|nr:PIG-L family deacetylase [Verrucomicrobiae bacterium]
MNAREFVSQFDHLIKKGRTLRPRKIPKRTRPWTPSKASKALIFSPHPDDECIVGGLALRLLREAKWNVVNVAVTLGSKKDRQPARRRELQNSCASLGFDLMVPREQGLEQITLKSCRQNRARWKSAVKIIAGILAGQRPHVIFVPHEHDGHPVHVGTHFLVMAALKMLPAGFTCHVVETEFWGPMTDPNLLVELSVADVADQVAALTCHTGEVRRNPYHARLPAWMVDNVRRGAELVGGQGGASPDFAFGTIYRLRKWSRSRLTEVRRGQRFLPCRANAGKLFE